MTNDELKKKIVEVIDSWADNAVKTKRSGASVYDPYNAAELADALVAAGIGDVSKLQKECDSKEEAYNKCYFDFKHWKDKAKEYKHRAAKAERALRNLAQFCAKGAGYYLQSDETAKKREQELYDEWIKQAEKELAEEADDE